MTWSFFDGLKKSKNEKETNHGWGEERVWELNNEQNLLLVSVMFTMKFTS